MACFRCNKTESLIFSLKYGQRKVDLNTSEKSLLFVTMRHRKFRLYFQLSYTKVSYLRKNTHLWKDAAFLHFRLKKSSENMIFPWNGNIQKLTKLLRWYCARDLFGSQIPVTTGEFELRISCIRSSYLTHYSYLTLLWSLEFVIQINLEHDTIAVWNLARSWSILTKIWSFLSFSQIFVRRKFHAVNSTQNFIMKGSKNESFNKS